MPTVEGISFFSPPFSSSSSFVGINEAVRHRQSSRFFLFFSTQREGGKKRLQSDNSLISLGEKKKKKSDAPARRG